MFVLSLLSWHKNKSWMRVARLCVTPSFASLCRPTRIYNDGPFCPSCATSVAEKPGLNDRLHLLVKLCVTKTNKNQPKWLCVIALYRKIVVYFHQCKDYFQIELWAFQLISDEFGYLWWELISEAGQTNYFHQIFSSQMSCSWWEPMGIYIVIANRSGNSKLKNKDLLIQKETEKWRWCTQQERPFASGSVFSSWANVETLGKETDVLRNTRGGILILMPLLMQRMMGTW